MRVAICLAGLLWTVGCAPASVAEAEARKDVAWLQAHESRAALEALGRLADHHAKAADALAARRGSQDVYHAAWQAHARGAIWGDAVLRAGLLTPSELPLVLRELPVSDPRLEGLHVELAQGAERAALAQPEDAAAAVALLASLGAPAKPELLRLLNAPATRETACRGLASPTVAPESRFVVTQAAPEARALAACQTALFEHASRDPRVLEWLGRSGEPVVIEAASTQLACPKLAAVWEKLLASSRANLEPFEPALATATARCAEALDPVLARAVPAEKRARLSVLRALDRDTASTSSLYATCNQLPRLRDGIAASAEVRELAERIHETRCAR